MFDKWLKVPAHYYLRITALTILIVGIAVSNVLMSIGAIWIISNWLIEADFKNYSLRLKQRPEVWLILGFLAYSILTLVWSDDFWYGFKDIKIKLPLLAIPLALGTGKPLETKVFNFILYVFIGIVAYTSVYNFIWYNYFLDSPTDIRQMSKFISQIRFATLVDLAIFSCVFLLFEKRLKIFLAAPLVAWFVFYMFKSQVLNGYVLFVILFIYSIYFGVRQLKLRALKWSITLISLVLLLASVFVINNTIKTYRGIDKPVISELEQFTLNGNPYYHDATILQTENGHFVWLYVSQIELENEWNKRSSIKYDSLDNKNQPMFGTILRYMTSKEIKKDSVGIWQLTEEEIKLIENGCTSVEMNNGVEAKVHSFLYEYDMYKAGANPNGFSLLQRLEHLKTAKLILADYWLFGVGIGDVDLIFQEYYVKSNSKLFPENRLRAHNQFISLWIGLGLLGLVVMILIFIIPLLKNKTNHYFLVITIMALAISFMFEDTLETQAGATIFALFYSIAVFREREIVKDKVDR